MTAERAVELLVMFDEETQTQVECCGEPMCLVERDFAERLNRCVTLIAPGDNLVEILNEVKI